MFMDTLWNNWYEVILELVTRPGSSCVPVNMTADGCLRNVFEKRSLPYTRDLAEAFSKFTQDNGIRPDEAPSLIHKFLFKVPSNGHQRMQRKIPGTDYIVSMAMCFHAEIVFTAWEPKTPDHWLTCGDLGGVGRTQTQHDPKLAKECILKAFPELIGIPERIDSQFGVLPFDIVIDRENADRFYRMLEKEN